MSSFAAATRKAVALNSPAGGWADFWQVAIDPTSIAAGARGSFTVDVPGVKSGDLVFASAEGPLAAELSLAGAKVTATDVVTIYLNNNIDATTAIDDASTKFNLQVIHLT